MKPRTQSKRLKRLSQVAIGLVACATISLTCVGTGVAGAQTASVSSVSKRSCTKARAKLSRSKAPTARKSLVRCKPGTTGSGTTGSGRTSTTGTTAKTPPPTTTTPLPPPPPPSNCITPSGELSSNFLTPQAGSQVVWRDDCSSANPLPLYGAFYGARTDGQTDMATTNFSQIASGRLSLQSSGGPDNLPYRRLTVVPGDQVWGNRDALGYNDHNSPVALWHEGQYRMLQTWLKLDAVNQTGDWRELFEIKQSQPYPSGMSADDGVMFELQQRSGKLVFMSHWHDLWSVPVTAGAWLPISVEGMWSADSAKGWLRFRVGNRVSPRFNGSNLLRNTNDGSTIPSYMEFGPYQSSSLPGFSVNFADLSVYG